MEQGAMSCVGRCFNLSGTKNCQHFPCCSLGSPRLQGNTCFTIWCTSFSISDLVACGLFLIFFHSSLCEMHFYSDTTILAARPWNGGTGAALTPSSPLLAPYHISHTSDRASKLQRKKIYNCNDIEKSSSF